MAQAIEGSNPSLSATAPARYLERVGPGAAGNDQLCRHLLERRPHLHRSQCFAPLAGRGQGNDLAGRTVEGGVEIFDGLVVGACLGGWVDTAVKPLPERALVVRGGDGDGHLRATRFHHLAQPYLEDAVAASTRPVPDWVSADLPMGHSESYPPPPRVRRRRCGGSGGGGAVKVSAPDHHHRPAMIPEPC